MKTDAMDTMDANPPANELKGRCENGGCEGAGHGVPSLTIEEADLLAPPPLKAYDPWVVPLKVRPNDNADTADD